MQGISFFEYISNILNQYLTISEDARPEKYRQLLPDEWKKSHIDSPN